MIHHERLKPPTRDYPADEWNIIEKGFHPEFLAQLETILALGNGYLGMRGCPEEGGPSAEMVRWIPVMLQHIRRERRSWRRLQRTTVARTVRCGGLVPLRCARRTCAGMP